MKVIKTGYAGKVKVFDGGLGEDTETPVYVGIDQSLTHYGITVLAKDGRYMSYVYMSPLRGVDRLSDIGLFIGEKIFEIYKIRDAAMEGYAYSSTMAHMAGEIGGFTKVELRDRKSTRLNSSHT